MKNGYLVRILCMFLCICMLLPGLSACAGKKEDPKPDGTVEESSTVTTQVEEDSKVETTEATASPNEGSTVETTNATTEADDTTTEVVEVTTEADDTTVETTDTTVPEESVTEGETTDTTVPEESDTEGETADVTVPEESYTEETTPEETTVDETTVEETTTEETTTEETTTEETTQGGDTETVYYKVSFAVALEEYKDRVTLPSDKLYKEGTVIEFLPTPSVKDLLFMGWYYDAAMTREVKLTDTVSADTTLYAKVVDTSDDIVAVDGVYYHTAFDVDTDYIFGIKADSIDDVRECLTIACVGSGSANLSEGDGYVITDNGDGTFKVAANYKAGKTYRVTLTSQKEICFVVDKKELSSQVTTLNVLTAKKEVANLTLSDGLIYIPISDILAISNVANGLVSVSTDGTTVNSGDTGVFVYQGANLKSGDRVAIYEGDIPTSRDYNTVNGNVKYLTITAAKENGVYEFRVSDSKEVIFIPDIFPISGKTNVECEAKISVTTLDFNSDFFKQLGMDDDTVVEAGDYIAFFDGSMTEGTDVEYVKIVSVSRDNSYYYVEYVPVSYDDVIASMDIYQTRTETPTLTEAQKEAIKVRVYNDAMNSGFIDNAADYLVNVYLSTNGLTKLPESTSSKYSMLSSKSGGGLYYEITKCEVKPEIKAGDGVLKHFEESDGIRVELVLSFEIEFTIGEDGKNKVVISAEAVFEEEILLSVNVDGGAVWEWYGIIPYIADYEMNANIDIGTYTGFSAVTKVYTNNGEEKEEEDDDDDSFFPDFDFDKIGEGDNYEEKAKNIGEELKKLFELNDNIKEEIEGEEEDDTGNDITEKYAEMMKDASEAWIELVKEEIYSQVINIDGFGILNFEIGVDFVISAQLYVVAGMEVETGIAKRYNFSVALFSRSVTTDVIDLEKEHFSFKFYCMGTAGIKVGFELEMSLSIISSDVTSVGISAELGVSLGIWGYFYYSYEKEGLEEPEIQKAGAMFFEIGVYVEVKFKAHLFNIDKLTYNPTLYENLWPIYSVGSQENVFEFEDYSTSQLTIRMQGTQTTVIPSYVFRMKYLDLKDGKYYSGKEPGDETPSKSFDDDTESRFIIEISDSRFTYDPKTNMLTTTMDVSSMEVGDSYEVTITITYKHGALAFNQEIISREITVVVTNDKEHRYIELYPSHKSLTLTTLPVKIGASVSVSDLPDYGVVEGYRHIGWEWESYHEGNSYNDPFNGINAMPENKNLALVAIWEPVEVEFSVRLFLERPDGIYVLDRTVTATSLCGEYFSFASIVPDGYERTADNLGVDVEYGGVYDLYLVREMKKIAFTDIDDDGNKIVVQFKAGAELTPPVVSKVGYIFAGWAKRNTSDVIELPKTVPYESEYRALYDGADFIYVAIWTPVSDVDYTIKHYVQNPNDSGYTLYMTEYATGNNKELIDADDHVSQAVLDGYFIYEKGVDATVELDGSSVVRLYYTREQFTLSYETNEGYTKKTIHKGAHGQTVDLSTLEIPRKDGYRFVGWSADNDGVADEFMIMPTSDTIIYPVWEGVDGTEYRIIHMLKNADDDNYTQIGVSYGYGVTGTLPDAMSIYDSKYIEDGKFVANYDKAKLEEIYVPYHSVVNGDQIATMYAYYDRVSYNANIKAYDPESGEVIKEVSVALPYGRNIFDRFLPELSQFNIDGYSASRYSNSGYTEMPDHDIEISVVYVANGQTPFLVYHYVQNTNGEYVLKKCVSQKGKIGENLSKNFKSYVLKSILEDSSIYADYCSENTYIERDGSTVLNIYYSRKATTVRGYVYKLDSDGNEVSRIYISEKHLVGEFFGGEGYFPYYVFDRMYISTTGQTITTQRGFTVQNMVYDVEIYLKPMNGVKYTVNEYCEKVDGTGYELTRTDYYVGAQDEVISAGRYTRSWIGRTVNTAMLEDIVLDGASENALNIYYDRNVYEIKFINEYVSGGNRTYSVKYGAPMPEAPTHTEIAGYDFIGWKGYDDYAGKEMPSTTIRFYAEYQPSSNTAYKVNHYIKGLDGTYSLVKTEELSGTTNAKISSFDYLLAEYNGNGFVSKDNTTLSIAPDGSTVMNIYYDRVSLSFSYHYYMGGKVVDKNSTFLLFGEAIPNSIYDYTTLYPEYALLGYSIYADGQYAPIDELPLVMGAEEIDIRVELEAIGPDVTVVHKVMNADGETYSEIIKTFVAIPFEELDLSAHVLTTLGAGFTHRIPQNNMIPSATEENVYEIYYDRNTYTVTYVSDYSFDWITEEYLFGATIGDAPAFTRPGYVQDGWTTEIPETMPARDITITAKWQLKESVKVTIVHAMAALDGNGYVEKGRDTVYATPELMLYGSYYAKGIAGGSYVKAENKTVAEDGSTVIYVYYSRNEYTVRFTYGDIAGALDDVVIKLPYESEITAPEFVVTGYNLVGWSPEFGGKIPAENITYVAIWQAASTTITVNHYVEGVDGQDRTIFETETISVGTGSTVNGSLYQKTIVGFEYEDADKNITVSADGSTVVNVYYKRNSYKLTFTYGEMNGEAVEYTLKYGATLPAAPEFKVDGYVLAGWDSALAKTMPAKNLTYAATWVADNNTAFTVEHYIQNANNDGYTMVDAVTKYGTTNTEVNGADFKLIFDYARFENGESKTIAADGSTTIKVYYVRATFKLTFTYGDKAGQSEEYTLRYGQNISYNPSFASQGYVFAGWDREIPTTMPAENVTINATWTAGDGVEYKVEHYVQNANNDEYTLEKTDNRTGMTGATVNGSNLATLVGNGIKLKSADNKEIAADGSTVIKIYYDRETYKVTYTYGTMTGENTVYNVRFGADMPDAPTFEAIGYTFAGWDSDVADTMPASDLTYIAQWTANTDTEFTVEHYYQNANDNEYTLIDSNTNYGTTASTVNGADYKQDFEEAIYEKADKSTIAADGSTVIKVYYTRTEYKLTFKYSFDSDACETFTLRYGQTLPEAPEFENVGYMFECWVDGEGCYVEAFEEEMPAYDLVYTASWMENDDTPFRVEHYVEQANGNGYDLIDSSIEFGRTNDWVDVYMYAYEDNDEYWFERVSNEDFTITPDGSGVLKIYYQRVRYTVTFYVVNQTGNFVDGVDFVTVEFKCGEIITPPEFTVLCGYEFSGYDTIYEVMPEYDIEYYIVWSCLHESLDRDDVCDRCFEPLDCTDANDDGHCDYCCTPNDPEDHRYADKDGDHICDICFGSFTDLCYDDDKDAKCDVCDTPTMCSITGEEHIDNDEDHICDDCKVWISYVCYPAEGRHECGTCYKPFYELCTDEDKDCWCDECGNSIPCVDVDGDEICDVCGNEMPCPGHVDEDQNAICDHCKENLQWCDEFDDMHRDENHDHTCDYCGLWMSYYCFDWNDDGRCEECYRPDYCNDNYDPHVDGDGDHYCDECGEWMSYLCVDEDKDWICDSCSNELTCFDHIDEDENAICDICREETKCKENPYDTYHADYDYDHVCDCCGVWMATYCYDDDWDGHCDECGKEFVCDHYDEDEDNYCDRCYRVINCTHEYVTNHYCDECYEKVSNCYDDDGDLWCDECYEQLECQHVGMEGEHVCYYCYDYLSDCYDADGDGECDLSEYFPHQVR